MVFGCWLTEKWPKSGKITSGCDNVAGDDCDHNDDRSLGKVRTGLKMSASMRGNKLDGWPHRRWLIDAEKCPKRGDNGDKPSERMIYRQRTHQRQRWWWILVNRHPSSGHDWIGPVAGGGSEILRRQAEVVVTLGCKSKITGKER